MDFVEYLCCDFCFMFGQGECFYEGMGIGEVEV